MRLAQPSQSPAEGLVAPALARPMEGGDDGACLRVSAVIVGPGTMGSCRCSTSKASSRSARITRSCAAGSGAMGATEPFEAVGRLFPSGVTPASGGGPSHGPSTRVSIPSSRSERARPRI